MSVKSQIFFYFLVIFFVSLSFLLFNFASQTAKAGVDEDLKEIESQITELSKQLELSQQATAPLESELSTLEGKLASLKNKLIQISFVIEKKDKEITQEEKNLAYQKEVFARAVREFYKKSQADLPLITLLGGDFASTTLRGVFFQTQTAKKDREIIISIAQRIGKLNEDKTKLEGEKKSLAKLQSQLDVRAGFLQKEVTGAKAFQESLQSQIADLTAKQQAILSARSGTFVTSVGEVPIGSDFNASIAFKSQAPANSLAVFAFGSYTHRNGMSQYGALGRAQAGQNAEQILQAYFPGSNLNKNYSVPGTISVQGYGEMPFEDQYMKRIYEVPNSWPKDVLKAQAVVARTYAIRASKPICTTEACQVYKNENKGGVWEEAVAETKGWVLENIPNAQYSSTTGGYLNNSGWDTTDKSNSGDWTTRAYESKAASPWFYKAWYRQGYRNDSASCSRSHPWLSQEEFADILNAWLVRKNSPSDDRIIPVTINSCPIGGVSGNPYSMAELRDKADGLGGAFTSVSSVSVSHSGSGQTTNVHLETNRGGIDIPGSEFKSTFNIRAPGYISIPQSGFAFFNIENK